MRYQYGINREKDLIAIMVGFDFIGHYDGDYYVFLCYVICAEIRYRCCRIYELDDGMDESGSRRRVIIFQS